MDRESLSDAVALGRAVGYVFLATAGDDGVPHLASAGALTSPAEGQLLVTEWFCPGTMENLAQNRMVAVVAWDEERDHGYQLVGRVEEIRERSVVDGYVPDCVEASPPQVERELVIRVDQILHFSQGPHTDQPE